MNLLFDLTASQPSAAIKRHGGGKYCEILFFNMCERNLKFHTFYNSDRFLNPKVSDYLKKYNIPLHDVKKHSLQLIVDQNNIDAIYSALPENLLPWPSCKMLGTIHGLRSLELNYDFYGHWLLDKGVMGLNSFLGFFLEKNNKTKILKYYQTILQSSNLSFVTDSNHSKKIIQSICPNIDIPVFYPPSTSVCQSNKTSKDMYFLLVSADRFEKNCTRAIIAIDKLLLEKKIPSNISVKITGSISNNSRYHIKNLSNFNFLGYVDEPELDDLYANAFAFIYPSLNEGFGYPPLEAMKYGVPVIASNAASIPEVCGRAALYFTPTSINEMKDRILDLLKPEIYSDLQRNGKARFNEIESKQKEDLDKLIDWIIFNST